MLYSFKQGKNMSLQRYYELFVNQVAVLDEVGISIVDEGLITAVANSNNRAVANKEDRAAAHEQALAIHFKQGAGEQYSGYLMHLRNSFLDGHDNYPETLFEAYNIMQRREGDRALLLSEDDAVDFVNDGQAAGKRNIRCFNSQEMGHYANECPKLMQTIPRRTPMAKHCAQ